MSAGARLSDDAVLHFHSQLDSQKYGEIMDESEEAFQNSGSRDEILSELFALKWILFPWMRTHCSEGKQIGCLPAPKRLANFRCEHHIKPAAKAAGLGSRVGWHTFRHTHGSTLRHLGVDLKVQQELLRHADVRTTMNVYTQAVSAQKREAHSRVVQMVLGQEANEK